MICWRDAAMPDATSLFYYCLSSPPHLHHRRLVAAIATLPAHRYAQRVDAKIIRLILLPCGSAAPMLAPAYPDYLRFSGRHSFRYFRRFSAVAMPDALMPFVQARCRRSVRCAV